jgi:hypothetical protein
VKSKFRSAAVPLGAFLLSVALATLSGPLQTAMGRQAAQCTGFISCGGDFDGKPNLTVTAFAVSLTPINFHSNLYGAEHSTATAHGRVKMYTVYNYIYTKKNLNNQVKLNQRMDCNDVHKTVACGFFNYTFPQLDCSKETLLARAAQLAPASEPPGANSVEVSFKACKPMDWSIDGDCNGSFFGTQLTGSLLLNKTGSGNSSNPTPPRCK